MKKLNIVVSLVGTLLLVGCVDPPKAKVNFANGTFSSPKDDAFANLEVDYYKSNCFGVVRAKTKAASVGGVMNPNVITATGNAQVDIQNSYINGVLNGMGIAAKYFSGQGGGGGFVPQIPIPVTIVTNTVFVTNTAPVTPAK